jgi:hypothetical protein
MNSTPTSIGRGPASGGNENHDGDPTNKTLGEKVGQETPAGAEPVIDKAAPDLRDAAKKANETYPDGPNVEDSPWELDTARGKFKHD